MKQNFAIVGLGRFGGSICRTLIEAGQEVLAIDSNEDRVNEYMNIATHAVVANAQDEMTLRSGHKKFRSCNCRYWRRYSSQYLSYSDGKGNGRTKYFSKSPK